MHRTRRETDADDHRREERGFTRLASASNSPTFDRFTIYAMTALAALVAQYRFEIALISPISDCDHRGQDKSIGAALSVRSEIVSRLVSEADTHGIRM